MSTTRRIAIVGGGVAGLGPAWQLARRGWDVHLFERDEIGCGASGRAAGMLAPNSEVTFEEEQLLRLGQASLKRYPRWVEELTDATGADLDYRRGGALIVAVDRDDAEELEQLYQYHQRLNLPVERLIGRQAHRMEPGLSPSVHYALFTPGDHQIDPAAMVEALGEAFVAAGGHLHQHQPVAKVLIGDKLEGLGFEDGSTEYFSHIVIAAGPWSSQLEGIPDGILPSIRPIRGQMLVVELGEPPLVEHVVRAPDAYLVPRRDGRLLIGSTMEERGFDPRPSAGGLLDILEGAREAVPGIYDAHILDYWTGFRPTTLANQPVIGPTSIDGLYLSVGHGRNGILLTPITAYGLAETIDTNELPSILRPFAPSG